MKIKLSDVSAAIRKNGLPQARRQLFHGYTKNGWATENPASIDPSRPFSACAIGQAAYNLDADALSLQTALSSIRYLDKGISGATIPQDLSTTIIRLNDRDFYGLTFIADEVDKIIERVGDQEITVKKNTPAYKKIKEAKGHG